MAEYRLSPDAESDLLAIARYTREAWGEPQLAQYEAALTACFERLGEDGPQASQRVPGLTHIRKSRCEHHVIFSLHRPGTPPSVIAVFHEKMDLMQRLAARLDEQ